jgi:hypothetical protein
MPGGTVAGSLLFPDVAAVRYAVVSGKSGVAASRK